VPVRLGEEVQEVPRDGSVIAIEIPKEKLREFCRKWKVTEFALFGSVTRPEEFRADSDVDVLVRFAPDAPWSLFDWVTMEDELKEIFGRDVDLVERRGVEQSRNYLRREAILSSAVLLEVA
jgi:hypothetical protein